MDPSKCLYRKSVRAAVTNRGSNTFLSFADGAGATATVKLYDEKDGKEAEKPGDFFRAFGRKCPANPLYADC